jgi:hypothetical protein
MEQKYRQIIAAQHALQATAPSALGCIGDHAFEIHSAQPALRLSLAVSFLKKI